MNKNNELQQRLAYDETFSCVQCGYCLPACPTYLTFKKETHSPRGRINLVKMAAEGKVRVEEIRDAIELCLGCRACETACPTNVQYGVILTAAINLLADEQKKRAKQRELVARKWLFEKSLTNTMLLRTAGKGVFFYQRTKTYKLVRTLKLNKLLPKSVRRMEQIIPPVTLPQERRMRWSQTSTKPVVGFFVGCIMDTFFARINDLSIQLLELAGYEVITIKEQNCCGALQHHAGEYMTSKRLAMKNIEAFESYSFDYIVNAIGGCGAALVEYPHQFDKDDPIYEKAQRFSAKSKDISYLLARATLPMTTTIARRATYQPSCHLTNVQKVVDEPLALIQRIPGLEYVPLPNSQLCCGSAGIYNIVHHEESMEILQHKMHDVKAIEPTLIITTNPGCHLQMLMGVEQAQMSDRIEVAHLVEVLAQACQLDS